MPVSVGALLEVNGKKGTTHAAVRDMVTLTLVPLAVPVHGLEEPEQAGTMVGEGTPVPVIPMVAAFSRVSSMICVHVRPSTTA